MSRSSPVPLRLQAKLAVSQPGDAFEQEADRVADAVVAGHGAPVTQISRGVQPKLYRMAARPEDLVDSRVPEGGAAAGGAAERDAPPQAAQPSEEVQRSAAGGEPATATPHFEQSVQHAVGGGSTGERLAGPARALMESRMEWDFSSIRIHHDSRADALAQQVNARAFTLGQDIFFARNEYQPDRTEGQRLLAHELVHTVQQSDGRVARQVQRATSCSAYPGYNAAADLRTYNCAGLACRTYNYVSPASAVYTEIASNFKTPYNPLDTCRGGEVKFWHWEYDLSFEDDLGAPVGSAGRDFHVVGARMPATGVEPTDVYSKNGARNVYGPGTGPSFRPATRERATSNDPSETPLDAPSGRPLFKVRTNYASDLSCADCY